MKEIFEGVGETMKELYDMLPFNDPDKKYQRALDKLKELKKRENDVYADIGRKSYKDNGAQAYPQEVEKLHKIYDERRMAELEVEKLDKERQPQGPLNTGKPCSQCGAENEPDVKFCRACGQRFSPPNDTVCGACGAQNPEGTRFCGFCGGRLDETPEP